MPTKIGYNPGSLFATGLYSTHLHTTALATRLDLAGQILSFGALPEGWHFGEGVPATVVTIAMALQLSETLEQAGADAIEAFPDIDGGILIAGYNNDETIEILVSPNNTYSYVFESGDEEQFQEDVASYAEVFEVIRALNWLNDSGSDYVTLNISARKNDVSPAWPFETQPAVEYPLLKWRASTEPLEQFVNTSKIFTHQRFQATQRSFGDLKKQTA